MISQVKYATSFRHSDCHTPHNARTDMQTPGQRIRGAREDAGYDNQGEFAKMVGLSQSSLSEIENGDSKLPSSPVLIRMCELLNKSPRWIVYGEDGDLSWPTKEEVELLNAFRHMTDEARAAFVATANALASKHNK